MRVKRALTQKQVNTALKKLPDWHANAKTTYIEATFTQPDYVSGLIFIARIVVHAELANHHPDITYTYAKVVVKLQTHDVSGVTNKDLALAQIISNLSH